MDGFPKASYEIVTHNYRPFNAAVAKYIEKLEQPDPRVASQAFAEKARGVGHILKCLGLAALLTLIGASLVVLCQQREPTPISESKASDLPNPPIIKPEPSLAGNSDNVVTNYTLFTNVQIVEGVDIVTGWNFGKSTDDKPDMQYCYLSTREEFGTRRIDLAQLPQSGGLIKYTSLAAFNGTVREVDYETALSKCRWFRR